MRHLRYILPAIFTVLISLDLSTQVRHEPSKDRGDPTARRKTNADGNQVRTTIFNFGLTGRTGVVPDEIPYEWPKNTRRMYIALTGIFIGGEVRDERDSLIQIVDVPTFRQGPAGQSWNLEPVPGYQNKTSKKIAISDDPSSWPPFWPDKLDDPIDPGWRGSWKGFFGKNQFNADQELYFRASDDRYDRYNYVPDTTDRTRRGMGLLIDVRILQWSQILINDVVFILHEIKNDGTKDIPRSAFTLWLADLVGGDGDSQDDMARFDLTTDIAWSLDRDNRGNAAFGSDKVGVGATAYLETPGNPFDGIDNDGDSRSPGSPEFREQDFGPGPGFDSPRTLSRTEAGTNPNFPNNRIVVITQTEIFSPQYKKNILIYDRRVLRLDSLLASNADTVTVTSLGKKYKVYHGVTLREIPNNELDDNLNGLIDENYHLHYKRVKFDGRIIPAKYKNYFTGAGVADLTIDERRDDGIDNDADWNPHLDDTGRDGAPDTRDEGENDGKPTPGEANFDQTDVEESDQIGLTNVQYLLAGAINFNTTPDDFFWLTMMQPGDFNVKDVVGDYDLFVSSGFFPLHAGRTERISMAVILGEDQDDALRNRDRAQESYNSDYRFARAPIIPTLKAVPGNRKVTLYWDDVAETSFDRFMANIGEPGNDFEGYRIYRATDPAFRDAFKITDASGNLVYYKPIAQFDRVNQWKGLHPVGVNGAHFDLGKNTGLRHSWTDTTVRNGQTYYYAVTAYDFGSVTAQIPPSETPILIRMQPDGTIETGRNVQVVTPNPPAAGYVPPSVSEIKLVQGSTTGKVSYEIVDPRLIKENRIYQITFQDTIRPAIRPGDSDTLTTKNFTLSDVTTPARPRVLISKSTLFNEGDENPVTDGFRLWFQNEKLVKLNRDRSRWSRSGLHDFAFAPFAFMFLKGAEKPSDYRIVFGSVGTGTSQAFSHPLAFGLNLPSRRVNFRVFNVSENKEIQFAFWELEGTDGQLTAHPNPAFSDIVIFLERDAKDSVLVTWSFKLRHLTGAANPAAGDTIDIRLDKPFLSMDKFEFTTKAATIDKKLASERLDRIKVVPNPYVAAATWEPLNPFNTGRGPRAIHFNHLPNKCTIRIYNISGEVVATIHHDSPIDNGTAVWNLLSNENLTVSYGVYIYHVEAPEIGEKIGKFAIIK